MMKHPETSNCRKLLLPRIRSKGQEEIMPPEAGECWNHEVVSCEEVQSVRDAVTAREHAQRIDGAGKKYPGFSLLQSVDLLPTHPMGQNKSVICQQIELLQR